MFVTVSDWCILNHIFFARFLSCCDNVSSLFNLSSRGNDRYSIIFRCISNGDEAFTFASRIRMRTMCALAWQVLEQYFWLYLAGVNVSPHTGHFIGFHTGIGVIGRPYLLQLLALFWQGSEQYIWLCCRGVYSLPQTLHLRGGKMCFFLMAISIP